MIYQIKLPATTIVVVDQNDESGRTFYGLPMQTRQKKTIKSQSPEILWFRFQISVHTLRIGRQLKAWRKMEYPV